MDGENELIHNGDIGTGKLFNLYSQILKSSDHSLDNYKEIIENTNVSDEIRSKAIECCKECERNKQETKKLIVNATVAISAMLIFAAVMAGKRY